MARKYLDPEKMYIVIVGDREKIEKGLQTLKIGPIKDMRIDEVLGKAPEVDLMK